MSGVTQSFRTVHYELRPAKQVERHMLVDALQRLADSGFDVRGYQYTGMGSLYFVDFILFHRALGMERMLSVEHCADIAKRVDFNRPYACVTTRIGGIGEVIPELDPELGHLLWLDYDDILQESHLRDVVLASSCLPVGSVLLVTIDTEPPEASVPSSSEGGQPVGRTKGGPSQWRDYYLKEAGDYLAPSLPVDDFARSKLPQIGASAVLGAARKGLVGRDLTFRQLFYFQYADGHRMITVGGIVTDQPCWRRLKRGPLLDAPYIRQDLGEGPCEIHVPRLTRKEKLLLDRYMPCPDGWVPDEFELSEADVEAYRNIYRFYPTYAELLL